jgi:cardiolipin synthase A/B
MEPEPSQSETVPAPVPAVSDSARTPAAEGRLEGAHVLNVAGNELRLFTESRAWLEAMLADLRAAQERIWLEVYIFGDDRAGREVARALGERAAAGLDVRLLYDAVGSQATPSAFFDALSADGVRVHAYHTIWDALRRFALFEVMNRRNHRKLLAVDERVAYFGGMNIVESAPVVGPPVEAAPTALVPGSRPTESGWRDVHVRLSGPQAIEVAESFARSWRRALRQPIRRRSRAYRRGMLPGGGGESIRFFDSGPGWKFSRAARIFPRLFARSQSTILMSMAYFLPTPRVLRALFKARRRGSRVRVIVPGNSDVKLVEWATRHLYGKLLRRRIEVYERQRRMLHSKVLVVDGQWSVVGSCNLDARSLRINYEFLAVIRSARFAAALSAICEDDIRHSRRITAEEMEGRSRWRRWLDRGAYVLRWWL